MATPKIGFIGLGRMGGPMSLRLISAGFDLVVFDTNSDAQAPQKSAGAAVGSSPKDVFDSVDLAFVSLPTPDIVEKVVLGNVEQGSRVKTVVDLSTSGPGMATRVSRGLEPYGVGWIDAPVSGGIAGAKKGTLAVMASGPRASFEIAEPLLKNFGKVFFVGEKAGLAQVAKLGNNLLAAAAMVISSEALVMGVKAGIDPKIMLDIINAGSGRNRNRFFRAPLISALRPGSPIRTSVCASTKRRAWACRWWSARRCARCSLSPTPNSGRRQTSLRSRASWRNGPA
jgi:3-hydroxyisobutyrate dehydrogenase-like beta-hydroxyacid dehydrogenase